MFGRSESSSTGCGCTCSVGDRTLLVRAEDCPESGAIAESEPCRHTVIDALAAADVDRIAVRTGGVERVYGARSVERLRSAGAFADRVAGRSARLAELARTDPAAAAAEARDRAGLVGEIAAGTGLADWPADESTADSLDAQRVPSVASSFLDLEPPPDGGLRTARELDSGGAVRIYDRPDDRSIYHVEPVEYTFDEPVLDTLAEARSRLVSTAVESPTGHREAVATVAGPSTPVDTVTRVLRKHTAGYGVLEDLFSDPHLSEVFVNAPAATNPLTVRIDGEAFRTNVMLGSRGTERLAAALRTETGRAFSRAAPTIDAALPDVGAVESVRVAGVREPASEGYAFALRAEGTDRWRLQRLVDNGTLSAPAAGLLSVAMARGASILVAGPRGAGKTTMASALLWELPATTRLLAIEDTPELPVRALQDAGRDVQRLEAASDPDATVDPATALRTALRFGNGALAVGEVRGEEAAVLYEAMRVGAASDTVIGTIHGDGYEGVKERVVADLGVPASSFAATDLLVTLAPARSGKRVTKIQEVLADGSATLYDTAGPELQPTSRIERGNSRLLSTLAGPAETYADVADLIAQRAADFERSPLWNEDAGVEADG